MSEVLSTGVPAQVADLFEFGEVKFVHGWGDRDTETCLHGALLRPCATPGDEVMWSVLLSSRGLTTGWNDAHTEEQVVAELREHGDPDVAEMVRVFGSRWEDARSICRRWAAATDAEKRDAWAAWDAWAAGAAWDVRDAWAAGAAGAAWDVRDAFLAVCASDFLTEGTEWDQAAYDRLVAPWESVFGPISGVDAPGEPA